MSENIIEAELVPMSADPSGSLALARADLDVQITTAKSYPRDPQEFIKRACEWATIDTATAESMIYEKPSSDGPIRGPSIRLAEIVQQAYGNLRVASRLVSVQQKIVVCEAIAHDLEANTAYRAEVASSIWSGRTNKRFPESVIQTTILAAQAKARRNAILAIVPGAFVHSILRAVEAKIAGSGSKTELEQRSEAMFRYWARFRVTEKEILDFLGLKKRAELTPDHFVTLRSKAEDLEGGTPVDVLFRRQAPAAAPREEAPTTDPTTAAVASALSKPPTSETSEPSSPATSDESKTESQTTSPAPSSETETDRQRARRLARDLVAKGTFKTQREIFDDLLMIVTEKGTLLTDEEVVEALTGGSSVEAPTASGGESAAADDARFDDVREADLDEKISEYEDKVAEKDVDGLSRAQEKVPGVMEDGATPATLRAYLRALDDELRR